MTEEEFFGKLAGIIGASSYTISPRDEVLQVCIADEVTRALMGTLLPAFREAVREAKAEGWDECATESGERGWMHNYAVDEMEGRNPYRDERNTP